MLISGMEKGGRDRYKSRNEEGRSGERMGGWWWTTWVGGWVDRLFALQLEAAPSPPSSSSLLLPRCRMERGQRKRRDREGEEGGCTPPSEREGETLFFFFSSPTFLHPLFLISFSMLQIPSSHFKRRPHFPSGPSSCTSTSPRHNHVPTHRRRARRRRKKKVRGETTSEPSLPWLLYCIAERWGLELDLTLEAEKEEERERGGRGEREKKGKVGAWKNVCLPGHSFLCWPTDSSSHDSPLPPLSFSFAADSGLRNTPPEKGEETLPPTSSVFRAKPARLWRVGGGGEEGRDLSRPPSLPPPIPPPTVPFRPSDPKLGRFLPRRVSASE